MKTRCPDQGTLQEFVIGNLERETFDRVADHIAGCCDCESALESFEHRSDDLIEDLRHVSDASPSVTPAVSSALLERARSAIDASNGDGPTLTTDAGSRLAQRLMEESVRLDRFELLEQIGVGSFGHVFRARDTRLDRIVAVKVQRASDLASEEETERFVREARSAAQLEHPSIVSLYEIGRTDDGICYLVTEFVDGETLEQLLRERKPQVREAVELVEQIARALQYAHSQGVVHRDVKPSNILVDHLEQPHIMDFGLAKRDAGEVTVTAAGEIMGTPAYMSPEQARGDSHDVDARSDVFSLGVILYELLTGVRPFHGNRRMLMLQLVEDDPRPPRRLNEQIPRDLETICLKAMSRSISHRYASCEALADDLARFARGEPIQARRPSVFVRVRHWCRSHPLAASLFMAVTLGATTGLLYLSILSKEFVQETALRSAQMHSDVLEQMNTFYSEIVTQLDGTDVEISHEYLDQTGVIPLPATFTIEAGRRISCSKSGMQVRLFSDYPFPWRTDGGAQDSFEVEALERLRQNPNQPHYKFTEVNGQHVLRYATARVMQASCLECHNTRIDSPKRDWKVGDVRGVLEISRPLQEDIERVHAGLRGSFVLVGVVSALLLGLAVLALFFGSTRRRQRLADRSGG